MGDRRLTLVGTYTGGNSRGIYALWLDPAAGRFESIGAVAEAENPSFLAAHPSRNVLYAVSELSTPEGEDGGRILAYSLDRTNGQLELMDERPTGGGSPCHLSLDPTGRYVFVSNYSGGSVAVFSLRDEGAFERMTEHRRHRGSGPNLSRQERPHPHSIRLDPQGRFVLVPDLGIDRVVVYRLDHENGKLTEDGASPALKPGAGPRHLDYHPNGRFVYVINELDSTVTAFEYDADQGRLREIHTVSTLPKGFTGTNWCADIHVHPTGRFLYGSNRGHDSIAIYEIDEATGRLTSLGHQSTQGKTPRNFCLDPSGRLLIAANQGSDVIVPFFIDQKTGLLTPTGHQTEVPAPVCIELV